MMRIRSRRRRARLGGRAGALPAGLAIVIALAAAAAGDRAGAQARPLSKKEARAVADSLLAPAREKLARADKDGAKGNLPDGHRAAEAELRALATRLQAAPDSARSGAFAAELRHAEVRAARLAASARFIRDLKDRDRGWEAVADQWNRDFDDLSQAADVRLDPELAGAAQARALIDAVGRLRLRCQSQADSLRAAWRGDRKGLMTDLATRDTTVAELNRQVSQLQQQLWEVQVRAGVAEADRSVAEANLRRRREREQTVQKLAAELGKTGGEVLLAPDGSVTIRVGGLAFPAGGAEITPDMSGALKKLVDAVGRFPDTTLRVEGHTDDTGSRAANLKLSQARADAIAGYLREQLHLGEESITAAGIGPDRPIATNGTPAGRAKNRRIDVVILAPAGESP